MLKTRRRKGEQILFMEGPKLIAVITILKVGVGGIRVEVGIEAIEEIRILRREAISESDNEVLQRLNINNFNLV